MSKKTLVSAITAALVVGAASTTFAAANPFSDVPADSWAYDAVSTLAADGVIDGYTDGTYKGQNTMTRYEMAQIVARAMAKTDVDKADKALVDKLAAEFAEELDNLGVRVADLEKKSDNVKFGGELRYTYTDIDNDDNKAENGTTNELLFRLEPKAYIGNTGWTANARIDYAVNPAHDENDDDADVSRIYVEGPLFGGTFQAGKLPVFTAQGLVFDDEITGAQYTVGDKLTFTAAAGRYNPDEDDQTVHQYVDENGFVKQEAGLKAKDFTAEYYGAELGYAPNDKLAFNAGYTALNGIDSEEAGRLVSNDSFNFWYAGAAYNFNDSLAFVGEYANSNADEDDSAYTVELQYKGADAADAGSWGAYAGYRDIEVNGSIAPTYDDIIGAGYKGFVVGATYAPVENVVATVEYFTGENTDTTAADNDASKFFGRVEFFF